MPAKKPKPDEKPQRERFIEAARESGADEPGNALDDAIAQIALRRHEVVAANPHSESLKSGEKDD